MKRVIVVVEYAFNDQLHAIPFFAEHMAAGKVLQAAFKAAQCSSDKLLMPVVRVSEPCELEL